MTLAKTITWRIIATLTTVSLVWLFTGSLKIAEAVGAVELVVKMILYYAHEEAWNVYRRSRDKAVG